MKFLAVLVALALPLAVYYPVNEDREATIRNLDNQIHELDVHIEQAKAAARKLPQFREEVRRLDVEVAKLRRILPPDPALDEIRDVVNRVAASSGIRIDRFAPRPANRREYLEVPIDTEAEGNLEALASFFDALRNKSRIINVSELTLEKTGSSRWRAKFLMAAFALPD